MVGSRPSKETAKRMGMVPYNGEGSANGGSGYVDNNGSVSNYNNNNNNNPNWSGYPDVKNGGYTKQGNAVPPNAMGDGNNQQLWSNNSGRQGPPPSWPTNENGAPMNPNSNNWQNRQTNASGPAGYVQGPQNGNNFNNSGSNGYVQPPQNVNSFGGPQRTISDGIPVNNNSNNWQNQGQGQNWQNQGQGQNWQNRGGNGQGQVSQGPQQRFNVPKGDYVYYDGSGNQLNPSGGPAGNRNGNQVGHPHEKHFHHHYYSSHSTQQQPYPYEVKRKQRSPAAAALVAALATCWVCTCCCHPGC